MHRYLVPLTLLLLAGCRVKDPDFGVGDGSSSSIDTDDTGGPDTGDSDDTSDTNDSTETGGDSGGKDYNFDDPGDLAPVEAVESPASLSLADESGEFNQDQEFYLLLVNNDSSDQTYGLRYVSDAEASARKKAGHGARAAASAASVGAPGHVSFPTPPVFHRDALSTDDVGVTQDEFWVRTNMVDQEWASKDATLWALGDHVAIWVDNEVAIDWDTDCDGTVDVPAPYDAYGFDNCDLNTVADVIDLNIYPNVTTLFGEPSDIDGDGRVDLFITPELNHITFTSETNQDAVLHSYAEPAVDLDDYDIKTNPGSDEREVIYAYAPDPQGYLHHGQEVSIPEYTNYSLLAEVARSLVSLVSYNQHIIVSEGTSVEEDWLNDVLGTLAADRCGFGAPFHADAWDYLDAPYNYPLLASGTKGSLDTTPKGAQYLFGLWLYQWAQTNTDDPDTFFQDILAQSEVGTDGVEASLTTHATETGITFDDLVIRWQLSLLGTGVTDGAGSALITDASFVAYPDAETLSSPPAALDNLYGANGYQRGVNLRGKNYAYTGGDSDAPELEDGSTVLLEGTDYYHYDPAFSFNGWIDGDYGAQVVRLDGIPYDAAGLELQFEGAGFLAEVVRWNDPTTKDYAVENIFSPRAVDSVTLPALPSDGTTIIGLGELREPEDVSAIDADGAATSSEVVDTDRWLLDLTDRTPGEEVYVAVWLDRRFDDGGDSYPSDPWIAVVPAAFLPVPTTTGTSSSALCTGAPTFSYPDSVLDYLYAQVFLSGTMGSEQTVTDACGVPETDPTTCDVDFDRDGVLDSGEPMPETFYDQVLVQQCTADGGALLPGEEPYSTKWLDQDEIDEDDDFSYDREFNIGGISGTKGEEGYVTVALTGGEQYIIVVGSPGDTGLYELSARQITK